MLANKTELLSMLERVRPGIREKDESNTLLDYVKFDEGVLYANNGNILVVVLTELDLTGAVRGKELYELVKRIKDRDIDITSDPKCFHIKTKSTKAKISVAKDFVMPIEYKALPDNLENFKKIPPKFIECLAACVPVCSNNAVNPALNFIKISSSFAEAFWDSTLEYIHYDFGKKYFDKGFCIPRNGAVNLLKFPEISWYMFEKDWIYFADKGKEVFYATRIIPEEKANFFPDCSNIRNSIEETDEPIIVHDVSSAVDRLTVFSATEYLPDQLITITIKGDKAKMTSSNSVGSIEETVKVETKVKDTVTFCINPISLKSCVHEGKVEFFVHNSSILVSKKENITYMVRISNND